MSGRVTNREEESVENAFEPSINCSESNLTFAKAHVMYSSAAARLIVRNEII